jgi:hypothetical protein
MADITYTVTDSSPEIIPGFEQYSEADKSLIDSFEINNLFDPQKHFSELHIYSTTDTLLESDSNYTRYKFLGNAQSAGKPGASNLTIDPVSDSIEYGYTNGGVKLLYHFINDLFTPDKSTAEFFINAISEDRTELRLLASTLDSSAIQQTALLFAEDLKNQSYFDGFRLNFGNNDLLIGINIGTIPYNEQTAVTIKLYEPLPDTYDIGSTLNIVEIISDSISYEIESQSPVEEIRFPTLRSPNFNIDIQDYSIVPSQYFNYNELFSYPVNNSNSQIFSVFNEKGIEISIDYTNYNDFVHFSSAQERLINFKYKLDLINSYSASLSSISGVTPTLAGASGSTTYYNGLIEGILSNFDHYERFLYYESGSNSWPKTNNKKPYINAVSTTPAAVTWYTDQISEATYFDNTNNNLLVNTIPTYLRDDANNEHYLTFIHMIGQHFDNLWLYGKAVSDKYDADNRLDFGISRDLVAEALKNFGVQLYTSNRSIQDLFTTIIGQSYQSGSEQITNYITGSYTGSNAPIQPTSYDNYQKEIYKRIYHNLPLLLSSKGTERGLRALINCFGIPQDILQIKLYGGRNVDERPFYGDYRYYTSSLDKIRLDHTGSLITGSTLSSYTSIYKRDPKYTDDLHAIEVGFSPTDNVDNYIVSYSLADGSLSSFNIDDYIGDPRNLTLDSYASFNSVGTIVDTLTNLTNRIMSGSAAYNVFDYVRLIKFFDNTIFKMVRDFIPARVTADTGIIIKPHLLQRNKAKSVLLSGSRSEHSGSIDTGFIESSNGDTFGINDSYTTISYIDLNNQSTNYRQVQTPLGLGRDYRHGHEETKFDGDFYGSNIAVTQGNLTQANTFTTEQFAELTYNIALVSGSAVICLLRATPPPLLITPNQPYPLSTFFAGAPTPSTIYTASVAGGNTVYPTFPSYTFTNDNFQQYQLITLQATASNLPNCQRSTQAMYASCSIQRVTANIPATIVANQSYNLTRFFTPANNSNIKYFVTRPIQDTTPGLIEVPNPADHTFRNTGYPPSTRITIEARDMRIENHGFNCREQFFVTVNNRCPITLPQSGDSYFFNNTTQFEENTSVDTQTFIVCRYEQNPLNPGVNITPTIKSLFATGPDEPGTRYYVQLTGREGAINGFDRFETIAFITPGSNLIIDYESVKDTLEYQWNGNEILTLKLFNGSNPSGSPTTWWGWTITGGHFDEYGNTRWGESSSQYLNTNTTSPTFTGAPGPPFSPPLKLTDCEIRITAFNPDDIYQGLCEESVFIVPPVVIGNPNEPLPCPWVCEPGTNGYILYQPSCVAPADNTNPCPQEVIV